MSGVREVAWGSRKPWVWPRTGHVWICLRTLMRYTVNAKKVGEAVIPETKACVRRAAWAHLCQIYSLGMNTWLPMGSCQVRMEQVLPVSLPNTETNDNIKMPLTPHFDQLPTGQVLGTSLCVAMKVAKVSAV